VDSFTYSGTNIVRNNSDEIYIKLPLSGEQRFVMRYDELDILEAIRESLVYGIRCDPFQVDGVEFIGIVGFAKINMIEERLKIDSFDGRGYTGIIGNSGNYVVNRNRGAGIGKIDNYYEGLRESAGFSEIEIESIIARMDRGESFLGNSVKYTQNDGRVILPLKFTH